MMSNQNNHSFWRIFHAAWGCDRGDGGRGSGYDKNAWLYVQAKIEVYLAQNPPIELPQKYRVMSSRFDTPEHVVGEFAERDDETAKQKFDRDFRYNQNYGWD